MAIVKKMISIKDVSNSASEEWTIFKKRKAIGTKLGKNFEEEKNGAWINSSNGCPEGKGICKLLTGTEHRLCNMNDKDNNSNNIRVKSKYIELNEIKIDSVIRLCNNSTVVITC